MRKEKYRNEILRRSIVTLFNWKCSLIQSEFIRLTNHRVSQFRRIIKPSMTIFKSIHYIRPTTLEMSWMKEESMQTTLKQPELTQATEGQNLPKKKEDQEASLLKDHTYIVRDYRNAYVLKAERRRMCWESPGILLPWALKMKSPFLMEGG